MTQAEQVQAILTALSQVIDPELGIDIVNLGLVYDIELSGSTATVTMTLTTMGCPLGSFLDEEIKRQVTNVDGISACLVKIVWYPVWTMDRISDQGKIALEITGE